MARHSERDDEQDDGEGLEAGLSRSAAALSGERADERDDERDDDDVDDEQDDAGDEESGDDSDDADDTADGDTGDDDDSDDDADDEDDDASDDDDEEEQDEDEESDDDDASEEIDPEVAAAAARHQLPTNFEDIVKQLPKEARAAARQAFQKRLKEVESGLGRAFQEARTERKELARLKAERKHEDEHRIDHIADLIDTDPKLLEQLNEELEKRETGAYRDAKKMQRETAKKELERAAEQETTVAEQRRQRGQTVAALAQRLAKDAGVPFKLIDKALYIAIMNSPEKDVTDEAIRRIVRQEARDWQKLTGERKREKKQEYIKDKSKKIKDSKRRVSARDRGHAPAPGRRREPKDLREALTRRAASILPDAPE